jgi:hypothetical protein
MFVNNILTIREENQMVEKHRIKRYRTPQQPISKSATAPKGNQMGAEIKHARPRSNINNTLTTLITHYNAIITLMDTNIYIYTTIFTQRQVP